MSIPGFYFCICPDAALSMEHTRNVLLPLLPDAEIKFFWADEGLPSAFWTALTLVSFVSTPRILVVRAAHLMPAEDWKRLSAALGKPHAEVLPVLFLEKPWEKGQPKLPEYIVKSKCHAFALEKKWAWTYGGLDRRSIRSFMQKEMQKRGLRCEGGVLDYLAEIILPDASAVKSLLDQIALVSENGMASREVVRQLAACTPEAVIFDLLGCIEKGNAGKAWQMLRNEGDGGEALLFPLLGLLSREARILWQLRAGETVYLSSYVERDKKQLAQRMDFRGIAKIFSLVCHAEMQVKSGEQKPLPALEALFISLTCLFRGCGGS